MFTDIADLPLRWVVTRTIHDGRDQTMDEAKDAGDLPEIPEDEQGDKDSDDAETPVPPGDDDAADVSEDETVEPISPGVRYEAYRNDAEAGDRTIGQFKDKPWSAGHDVAELQDMLNAQYPRLSRLAMDGHYGYKTTDRVKYLQHKAKIEIDGITGTQTWSAAIRRGRAD